MQANLRQRMKRVLTWSGVARGGEQEHGGQHHQGDGHQRGESHKLWHHSIFVFLVHVQEDLLILAMTGVDMA